MASRDWGRERNLRLMEELKKHTCLWDVSTPDYRNRTKKKDTFYEIGLLFNVDSTEIEKRIHNLKSQFHRECAKEEKSKVSSSGTDHVYVSRWYGLEHLTFLKDVHRSFKNSTDEENSILPTSPDERSLLKRSLQDSFADTPTLERKRRLSNEDSADPRQPCSAACHTPEDECDVFGKNVAFKLRHMQDRQRIIAEKVISDALFHGQFDNLAETSCVTIAPKSEEL